MIKVALSPDAVLDYDESFSWYAKRSRKSALELEDEVAAAIDRIASDYEACPHFDDVYQYTRLKRYPFFVVFRVEGGIRHTLLRSRTPVEAPGTGNSESNRRRALIVPPREAPRSRAAERAGAGGREVGGRRGAEALLEGGNPFGDAWLERVEGVGALVVGEGLRQIPRLFLDASQRGVDAGIVEVELEGLLQLQLGGPQVAIFFIEAGELHAGIRRLRAG